jgi:hypothetical protein
MNSGSHKIGNRVLLFGLEQQDRNYCMAEVQKVHEQVTDIGCRVRIHSLVSASDLNGKEGLIVEPVAAATQRVGVYIERSGTDGPKSIKVSNLLPIDPHITVKLRSGHEMKLKAQHVLPVQMQSTTLRAPSAGCLHVSDRNVYHLLDGLLWHCNVVTAQLPAPFDPSHVAKLRETVEGRQTLHMLAQACVPIWHQVLKSLCNWVKSRPIDKPPLPFMSDLNLHTDIARWSQTGVSGRFWVCKQNKDGALLIQKGRELNSAIFSVLGLNCDFASLSPSGALPFAVSATLLPYRGRIIHNNLAQAVSDGASLYPSLSMAKVLENRVKFETPLFSLPALPCVDGALALAENALTAFALVEQMEATAVE